MRLLLYLAATVAAALTGAEADRVLIVSNSRSPSSKPIAEYYARKRGVPPAHLCVIGAPVTEEITRAEYESDVAKPVAECLSRLLPKIDYIVTTTGVPLKIRGGAGMNGDQAAVDSELALLRVRLSGRRHPLRGPFPNPYFDKQNSRFDHAKWPIYLVTRLTGYSFADVKALIDRSLRASNSGLIVLDLRRTGGELGDDWLREAAERLPAARVLLEESNDVVHDRKGVFGYASWGSNDPNRKRRLLGFTWAPGALATEFVSTNGRSFAQPPDGWTIAPWKGSDHSKWFAGSPQTLTADLIHEGVTGASGHVYEPFLGFTPRPQILFPAYLAGRNLAESFYLSTPALSWQNIVIGDPLCRVVAAVP